MTRHRLRRQTARGAACRGWGRRAAGGVPGAGGGAGAETDIRPACHACNRSYGVDAAFMSFQVHGRGIHIV
jgi:hypothetical protein